MTTPSPPPQAPTKRRLPPQPVLDGPTEAMLMRTSASLTQSPTTASPEIEVGRREPSEPLPDEPPDYTFPGASDSDYGDTDDDDDVLTIPAAKRPRLSDKITVRRRRHPGLTNEAAALNEDKDAIEVAKDEDVIEDAEHEDVLEDTAILCLQDDEDPEGLALSPPRALIVPAADSISTRRPIVRYARPPRLPTLPEGDGSHSSPRSQPQLDLPPNGPHQMRAVRSLEPGTWLDDIVVNNAIAFVASADPLWYAIDSCNNASPITPPSSANMLVLPIFDKDRQHWTLATCNLKRSQIYHFDPLAAPRPSTSDLTATLSHRLGMERLESHSVACPQQQNCSDCGVFVISMAMSIIADRPVPASLDGSFWRLLLARFLVDLPNDQAVAEAGDGNGEAACLLTYKDPNEQSLCLARRYCISIDIY